MRILLVNDDGIFAEGIGALATALKKEHEVIMVAPESERSGYSHMLTYYKNVTVRKVSVPDNEDVEAYSVSASPADCAKFGLMEVLKDRKPDLVISGINNGMNVGTDICYSGTVGAATEAAMFGYRAMAVSCYVKKDQPTDFAYAAEYVNGFIESFDFDTLPKGTLINLNFPREGRNHKGVLLTTIGKMEYHEHYTFEQDNGDGSAEYHLRGTLEPSAEENSDVWAMQNGYISITPLKFDRADYDFMNNLRYLMK